MRDGMKKTVREGYGVSRKGEGRGEKEEELTGVD
jgi:hypothetical protein